MRFRTASTTQYELKNVEKNEDGVWPPYTADLARIANQGLAHVNGGRIENDAEFYSVMFYELPTVGYRFQYIHELWGGCLSTDVSEIFED